MIKKVKNMFTFLFFFVISCGKLIINVLCFFLRIKDIISDGVNWVAFLYQPFLVMVVIALFIRKLDILLYGFLKGQGNVVNMLLQIIVIVGIILLVNSFIELLFRIICKNKDFAKFFSVQKNAYNYMMAIISLIAIYTAINSNNATEINTILLALGILIFFCIIITDLYQFFFLSQEVVEKIVKDLQKKYEQHKN